MCLKNTQQPEMSRVGVRVGGFKGIRRRDAANPNVWFDERGVETEAWWS